jgi:hypothetical protein
VRRTNPATRTNNAGTNNTWARDSAPAHHGPACRAAARADHRGSAHGASTSHGAPSTSRANLDYRAILLELLLKRTIGSTSESRRRQSRHRETRKTDDDRAGDAFESVRCAANLTNESHHGRLHCQALSCLHLAASLICAAITSVSTSSLLIAS